MNWEEFTICLSTEISKKGGCVRKFILDKEAGLYEDYIEVKLNGVCLLINDELKEISALGIVPIDDCFSNRSTTDTLLMTHCTIDDYINCVEAIYRVTIKE